MIEVNNMGDWMRWTTGEREYGYELDFVARPEGEVEIELWQGVDILHLVEMDKDKLRSLGEYIKDTLEVMDDWEKREMNKCKICDDVVLPEHMVEGVCPSCNRIIGKILMMANVPIHRNRVEKMAFVIRFHAEALRRLSE